MRNAVNGLLYCANHRPPIGSNNIRARRLETIDNLTFDKIALEVCGDEVNAANLAAITRGVGKQATCGSMTQRFGKSLIVVDALFKCTPLNTQARFSRPIAFHFEHPNKPMDAPPARHIRSIDEVPRFIGAMVGEFFRNGVRPRRPAGNCLGAYVSGAPGESARRPY